jgi:hypothetical protein
MLTSQEGLSWVVDFAYQKLLHRPSDSGGQLFWWPLIQNHVVRQEDFLAAVAGSPEYFLVSAGGTRQGLILQAYQDLLGRAADPAGYSWWLSQLNSGMTSAALCAMIASTPEFVR